MATAKTGNYRSKATGEIKSYATGKVVAPAKSSSSSSGSSSGGGSSSSKSSGSTTVIGKTYYSTIQKKTFTAPAGQEYYKNSAGTVLLRNTGDSNSSGTKIEQIEESNGNVASRASQGAYKDSSYYKSLTADQKALIDVSYNVLDMGNDADYAALTKAIEAASAIADPYEKAMLAMATAEITSNIAKIGGDYETASAIIKDAQKSLMETVVMNKEYLTMEQQADLAIAAKQYDKDLLGIANDASEKGLTFATGELSRQGAEIKRKDAYQDVVQTSNRTLNYKTKALEMQAAQGDREAQLKLQDQQNQKQFNIQRIGQEYEKLMGSANAPDIAGYTKVGGLIGTIKEDKDKKFADLVKSYYGLNLGAV